MEDKALNKETGIIKWFSNSKGFGFILNETGNSDIFVHYSSIAIEGYKSLKAGQMVQYRMEESEKGLHAVDVIPVKGQNKAD
jgi:CspA family cold shock protein